MKIRGLCRRTALARCDLPPRPICCGPNPRTRQHSCRMETWRAKQDLQSVGGDVTPTCPGSAWTCTRPSNKCTTCASTMSSNTIRSIPTRNAPQGNTHTTPHKPNRATKPSSPPIISRRLPSSSSFVLAAARHGRCNLTPPRAARRPSAPTRKIQKNSQPQPGGGTRSHRARPLCHFDRMTLMGAADCVFLVATMPNIAQRYVR